MIRLGDRVKDLVTGIEGIAVASTEWLNGCVRFTVEYRGGTKESPETKRETMDEEQLVVVKTGAVNVNRIRADRPQPELRRAGGGRPDAVRR
jgi:hypothetical protein